MSADKELTKNNESAVCIGMSTGRRRLLRGGLGAAPVLMTLVSRPVIAANCTAASAMASINASRPDVLSTCSGQTPSQWTQGLGNWPAAYVANGTNATLFNSVFATSPAYTGKTLLDVLKTTDTANELARYLVASLLNVAKGLVPANVLTTTLVKELWAAALSPGYYVPTAGIKWYPAYSEPASVGGGIIAWLKTTIG